MSDRIRKINELIREEASKSIAEVLGKDFFVTVTAVETSKDLRNATIWVSTLSDEKKTLEALNENKSEIQRSVTEKMYSKYTPRIEFKIDHSQEHAQRISELLRNDEE